MDDIMSTWQIILLLVFVFLVSLCFSFSKKPSKKRTLMRVVSVFILISFVVVGYMLNSALKDVRKCPDSGKFFYESKGELCYSTTNVNSMVTDKLKININKFVIMDRNSAIFNTVDNVQYSLSYDESDGMMIRPLN